MGEPSLWRIKNRREDQNVHFRDCLPTHLPHSWSQSCASLMSSAPCPSRDPDPSRAGQLCLVVVGKGAELCGPGAHMHVWVQNTNGTQGSPPPLPPPRWWPPLPHCVQSAQLSKLGTRVETLGCQAFQNAEQEVTKTRAMKTLETHDGVAGHCIEKGQDTGEPSSMPEPVAVSRCDKQATVQASEAERMNC